MSLKIIDNLEPEKKEELEKILELYKSSYPEYINWNEKTQYFNKENVIRTNIEREENNLKAIFLGYLIRDDKLVLDDNFIKFIYLRYDGLQSCIYNKELYLENNKDKDTRDERKYLEFLQEELKKLKELICKYELNKINIDNDKDKKIEFLKEVCNTITWGFEDDFSTCTNILERKDLHSKTYGVDKQLVLGSLDTDWLIFLGCNSLFVGKKIMANNNKVDLSIKLIKVCDKTVEFNLLLNKYATLTAYYKKAKFIRFILLDGLAMPHRRYPPIKKKEKSIGSLHFGPFIFNIYDEKHPLNKIYFTNFDNFTFYDEKNYNIIPPLLRSSITITYTEFRDLLCYLNLPVFRSTVNRNMLFFPNYDLHQRLLEIQGLPRNYSDYTGSSIDWKWFKEGETAAKEAITCFCQEYEESPGYGIEPVEYVWYDVVYPDSGNIKKFIFLVVPFEDLEHYTGSDIYKRDGKYYICNKDEVPEHMVSQLFKEKKLEQVDYIWYEKYLFINISLAEVIKYEKKITAFKNKEGKIYYCTKSFTKDKVPWKGLTKVAQKSFREKYLKYKTKYLILKNLLQKMKNNI